MPIIFLTHEDDARAHYYGDEALARLRALGEVRLNETGRPLTTADVIELAAGCEVIVSYRQTGGPAEIFEKLPDLIAFVRCAVDIRNVDVGAASAAGVLVTRASPGFVDAVAELALGLMVDLARGITDATQAYRAGSPPPPPWAASSAAAPWASSATAASARGWPSSASRSACASW